MDFEEIIGKFCEQRILIIGDLMVDQYIRGNVERISPEAPVQIVDIEEEESVPGGMGNTVKNLSGLGAPMAVLSVIGNDSYGQWLVDDFEKLNISMDGVLKIAERITTVKTRIVVDRHQLLRYDKETRKSIGTLTENRLIEKIKNTIDMATCVLVSDYGKGVLTQNVLNAVMFEARNRNIPVIVDPKGEDFIKYESATFITPNRKEAAIASKINIIDEITLKQAAYKLIAKCKIDNLLITCGEEGIGLFVKEPSSVTEMLTIKNYTISAQAQEVYDVTGAGDTVLAVFGLAISAGAVPYDAACLANLAAGLVVGKVGTSSITKKELLEIL